MKNVISALVSVSLIFLVSCTDENGDASQSVNVDIQFQLEAPYDTLNLNGIEVAIENKEKGYSLKAVSNEFGELSIEDVEKGSYVISCSHLYEGGMIDLALNGSAEVVFTEDESMVLNLVVAKIQSQGAGLIIKEYYYSGSYKPDSTKYFDDKFIELYNNGASTVYLDSILLVEHGSYGTAPSLWLDIIETSITGRSVWSFPGENIKVAAGESVIVAVDGLNHKSDTLGNVNSPVNLGSANYEFFATKNNKDLDYAAHNLIKQLWIYEGTEFSFHPNGGSAMALVKIKEGNLDTYVENNLIRTAGKEYAVFPNDWVIDAVETCLPHKINKRFHVSLDAGVAINQSGSWSGKGIRRKIADVIDGRVVYQDTNNSSNDFLTDVVPSPGVHE